jgi:hypothetical protein
MKIISISKLKPISVYTDKHVSMNVKMDKWMDEHIYVRNVVCIVNACLEVRVYIYAELCQVFMYI